MKQYISFWYFSEWDPEWDNILKSDDLKDLVPGAEVDLNKHWLEVLVDQEDKKNSK